MDAVAAALLVVLPQLGDARRMRQETHLIYFGHLRSWDVTALQERLVDMSGAQQVEQLAVQLTRVAVGN